MLATIQSAADCCRDFSAIVCKSASLMPTSSLNLTSRPRKSQSARILSTSFGARTRRSHSSGSSLLILPAERSSSFPSAEGVDAVAQIIADGGAMDDGVLACKGDLRGHQILEIIESSIWATRPARRIEIRLAEDFGMRRGERHLVAAAIRFERDGGAGAAGEDVGDATDPVDRGLRVARGDEDAHVSLYSKGPPTQEAAACVRGVGSNIVHSPSPGTPGEGAGVHVRPHPPPFSRNTGRGVDGYG